MTRPRGWHSRGYLPHFDSPEAIQFVTFRLADSLPRAVTQMLRHREDEIHRVQAPADWTWSSAGSRVHEAYA